MKKQDRKTNRKIGIPYFSFYTKYFKELFQDLGLDVIEPIPINQETIRLGVKHSPEMFCFPYKIVLGNCLQLIKNGANTIVMFNSCGTCKFRHYHKLIGMKLRELEYDFEMIAVRPKDFIPIPLPPFMNQFVQLSGKNKRFIAKVLKKKWKDVKAEEQYRYVDKKFGKINIAITGEIFSVLEESVNHDVAKKLEDLGATVHSSLNIRAMIKPKWLLSTEKKILRKTALSFLDNSDPGGHGIHSIMDVLYWHKREIDGIIHIMPLSCHPEILVEDVVNYLCKKNKIPLLKIAVDETSSTLNIATRIETFYELIKRRKEL